MAGKTIVHFNPSTNPLHNASHGSSVCGTPGTITGYPGAVTCPDCKPIAKDYQREMASLRISK